MDAPSNAGKHLAAHRMLSDMQNRLWNVAALRHLRARSASKTSQGGMPFYAIEMARRESRSPVRVTAASDLGVLSPDLFPLCVDSFGCIYSPDPALVSLCHSRCRSVMIHGSVAVLRIVSACVFV